MGDYTALATRTGFVPARVQNIPTGAVVTDLMAGEAFGMAVLQSGAVYVAVKPDTSFFLIHGFHSISFTRAQGIPKYKIGFGREKDGRVGERLVEFATRICMPGTVSD
jgi:hypothetical protein